MTLTDFLQLAGAGLAPLALIYYGFRIAKGKADAGNIATWSMWTAIDVILLITAWQSNTDTWVLPFGWVVGAVVVTGFSIKYGKWAWTRTETMSLIFATIATIVWLELGPEKGMVAGTLALVFAGIPLVIDMTKTPAPNTFFLWATTVVACTLTILGSNWTFNSIFLPLASMSYNGFVAYLSIRKV